MFPSCHPANAGRWVDRLVEALTAQQFLHPHHPLERALDILVSREGVCPDAAREGIRTMDLDVGLKIGRMPRSQLIQLAHVISRLWRQSVASRATERSQPM